MPNVEPLVFVVDDDAAVRNSLQVLLKSVGMKSHVCASAEEFLAVYDPRQPGCLVLDIRMPGMNGLELLKRMNAQRITLPVIILSGHGDIRMAVDAVQAGAIDFLEKPIRGHTLLDGVRAAIERDAESRRQRTERVDVESRMATLSPREREILDSVVAGKSNKVIAAEICRSHKTIETHRSNIMRKMQTHNVVELVRMVLTADTNPGES